MVTVSSDDVRMSRLPLYGCRCHGAGLISHTHVQHSSDQVHVGRQKPITFTHAVSFSLRLFLDSDGCITVVLLPTVYLYLQGQTHYFRRVAGMMYLDSTRTVLKVSHLSFWGHRRDIYSTDVMTLGESGDTKGELILGLKRYSRSDTLYFSTRLGRMVDKKAFEKVFGSLS
uniref:Transmembrane protein 186 n=1 Tax=Cyprinus carpio carpio TaxID=630221 RepID=A0A8C1F513_CYPCA